MKLSQNDGKLTDKGLEDELKSSGLAVLKANKVETKAIEKFLVDPDCDPEMLSAAITLKLSKTFKDSQQFQDLLVGLLIVDPQKLSNLKDLRRGINKTPSKLYFLF